MLVGYVEATIESAGPAAFVLAEKKRPSWFYKKPNKAINNQTKSARATATHRNTREQPQQQHHNHQTEPGHGIYVIG